MLYHLSHHNQPIGLMNLDDIISWSELGKWRSGGCQSGIVPWRHTGHSTTMSNIGQVMPTTMKSKSSTEESFLKENHQIWNLSSLIQFGFRAVTQNILLKLKMAVIAVCEALAHYCYWMIRLLVMLSV